jgi:hypothetical protein
MQLLNVTTLPIYLPYDTAHVPFGDAFEDVSITSSVTAIVTVPGYDAPQLYDRIIFSDLTSGAIESTGLAVQTIYYVQGSIAGDTFAISSTSGGNPLPTLAALVSGSATVHLISGQVDGVTLPFKPGYTVLVENNNPYAVSLYGAPDKNPNLAIGNYQPPQGPGAATLIATLTSGQQTLVQLGFDWIYTSASGTLTLQQN